MPLFVTTGCVVGCCYSRGVYPVRADLPLTASAIVIGDVLRLRRISSILKVSVRRLHTLGPRCGQSVVPKGARPSMLGLPTSRACTFISGRSSICARHVRRLLTGYVPIGTTSKSGGLALRGVARIMTSNRGVCAVTGHCNIAPGSVHG